MSTPSMVLLCAGAAASLSGVWALAGLSESSSFRTTPRVALTGIIGMLGIAAVHFRAPAELRSDLGLPALFGMASVLALTAGAAKLEGALRERDGARALRRSAGLIAGTVLGMAAVAAVSLELVLTSLVHARLGWAYMLPLVASLLMAFAARARLAGGGALALGGRGLTAGLVGLMLLIVARTTVSPKPARAEAIPPPAVAVADPPLPAGSAVSAAAVANGSAPPAGPSIAAVPAGASPSADPASPSAAPGALQIESLVAHGLFEADARGGVTRRLDKLQACLDDPKNRQSGSLTLKVGIDGAGSVDYSRATGGDLVGTPLAECLLPVFYKMGFAAPAADSSYLEITLRAPAP
jgi:hypothetical protein